ncbi:biotin-dependent carboxyltransferase family protein [uncultured Oscillibacter sp.]|uniref:5-oxoprolinase subunit C family protein n=1 Tax=uncultured Oscillibacter sp. TaxID=876091 RepID=UPI0025FD7954|nr:biotin-dependent carboxyltransferase family protein [uncultured Oscillibacter sp.]
MSIEVLHPGLLTTVQDLGRTGYQRFGVSVSGAVDPRSAAVANILAGNPDGEAVLECTVLGPQLRFDAPAVIAVTGADLGPTLDGVPVENYRALRVQAGQTLRFTGPKCGCRAYLAVSGGLDVPEVMGSRSTYMKAKIGGWHGRKLEKGDVLPLRAPGTEPKALENRALAPEFRGRSEYTLRVVMGPQDDAFTPGGVSAFLSGVYTVTPEFDRMGCRMEGPEIEHNGSADILSDGIAFGAVQVPDSGQPIVMLADRQTTGGYTKIANVISADFRILGQLKSGDRVRFEKVSLAAAQEALLAQRASLRLLRHVLDG